MKERGQGRVVRQRTRLRRVGERGILALLERRLADAGTRRAAVEVGIGDDAAVLRSGGQRLVWTVDACVEGVHFERGWLDFADIGWRAVQAAASDLAAMGARPLGALSSLIVPASVRPSDLDQIAMGQAEAARALGCPIVGGNVARGGELSLSISVLGEARHVLLRSGASPNNDLWLVGDVGLAAAGVELLRTGRSTGTNKAVRACLKAWRRPTALLSRGRALVGRASAAIDVSDGLSGDALRISEASGVRLVLDEAALRACLRREVVEAARLLDVDAFELALRGGEDYALLATGVGWRRPTWARRIGRVERGTGAVLESVSGSRTPLAEGFDHFA